MMKRFWISQHLLSFQAAGFSRLLDSCDRSHSTLEQSFLELLSIRLAVHALELLA